MILINILLVLLIFLILSDLYIKNSPKSKLNLVPINYKIKAKKIYTRDFLTANDLTLQLKKKVSFLGNPFMDKFFPRNKELKKAEFSIGLFPGSRFPETLDNFVLILEVLEELSDLRYFQKIEFNFAIVNALSSSKIKKIFQNHY